MNSSIKWLLTAFGVGMAVLLATMFLIVVLTRPTEAMPWYVNGGIGLIAGSIGIVTANKCLGKPRPYRS